MPIKLTKREFVAITVAVAVAAISLAVALKYFSRAFPEATLRLRVNRSQSEAIAREFLAQRGDNLTGYRHAAIFDYDDTTKLYLERTQGLDRMNQLTSGPVHLWRWTHRWFKPQQKEEFEVDVTTDGQVVGFHHEIAEATAGANLLQAQARTLAESFLTSVMKRNLSDLDFVEASQTKRPARTDYAFTWKLRSVNLGAGSLRVEVEIDGNQVAGLSQYVKIPENWTRGYEKIRSRNDAAQEIDQVFWCLLILAMLVILVRRLRDRDVPLRISLALGLVAVALELLSRLNNFPLEEFTYRTTDSFPNFLTTYFLTAVLGALGVGALIFLVVASAEPVYREALPGMLSFRRIFSWNGLRTRSFLMANIVGIALTFFFFAYQTVFYLAANHLGAWAPSDIPFSNQLNTAIPWAAVLFTGFFPAITEEMQFRAFAIPFLKRFARWWPLAIVLAAFNWGFLHAAYPNQPFFIRGVEVGVGGVIIGFIMLRFGILATLIWHYSVDALYEAFILLRSSNHYLMLSGGLAAGVMLIPLVVALAAYLKTGTFVGESPLTNAGEGIVRAAREAPVEAKPEIHYQPYSKRRLLAALIATVVCIAVAAVASRVVKVYRLGKGVKVGVTRAAAITTAEKYLDSLLVNAASFHTAAWLRENVDPLALRYFLERMPVEKAGRIIRESSEPMLWEVRFFRPLEKEEQIVFVDAQNGKIYGREHLLPETAPGAALTPAQALALGQQELVKQGYQLSNFVLQDSTALRRPAREDYTLVWQARPSDPRNVGDARYRLEVELAGDQVAGFRRFFKLPESWVRKQESTRLADSVFSGAAVLLGIGLIAGGVWLFAVQVRRGAMRWMKALKAAAVFTALLVLYELNALPALGRVYDTSISLANFRLQIGVSYLVLMLFAGALMWLLTALATSLYPESWGLFDGAARRLWRRDAVVATIVSFAVGAGVTMLLAFLSDRFHSYALAAYPGPPAQWGSLLPGLGLLVKSLLATFVSLVILAAAIYGVVLGWRRKAWWFWLGAALLLIALGRSSAHGAAAFIFGWLLSAMPLAAGVLVIAVFFRDNPLAYAASIFASIIIAPAVELLSSPASFYRWNGAFLSVAGAAVLAWLLLPRGKRKSEDAAPPLSLLN